jgi:atypical dual specificity phosphatase
MLAGSAYPAERDLAELAALGVRLLVNLHARRHPPATLARLGLTELHLPVEDFTAPTVEQLARGVEAIAEEVEAGGKTLVHCGYGLGRTGTMLAAYLVRRGLRPTEAIERIRAERPGSVETADQSAAIAAYADWLAREGR